ncbi:MAG: peroxiredoxin-like family protein [Melioribacteraceae bacterium]|nr:peroxiredoxin-like family protein [Melioribacteraceae bacterium]
MNYKLSILFILLPIWLFGQDNLSKLGIQSNQDFDLSALEIGELAPDFTAVDQRGNEVVLSEILKNSQVALIFYRGYWCSICSRHLKAFEEELYKLKDQGIEVIAITPESYENVRKTIEKTSISIPVVSDRDLSIMINYKVAFSVTEDYQEKIRQYLSADISEINGMDDAVLPVPATYLIGQDQKIKFAHFDPDYKNRASVSDILKYANE